MIGLILMVVGVLYFLLLIWVTRFAYRWAKTKGYSRKKCVLAGVGGFLIVYLPVFWDHIPTLVAFHYYCASDAGFQVYKGRNTWVQENVGKHKTLLDEVGSRVTNQSSRSSDGHEIQNTYVITDRVNWIVVQKDVSWILPIVRTEQSVMDSFNGEILAIFRNYSSGNSVKETKGPPGPLRFWNSRISCGGGTEAEEEFRKFKAYFYG